MRGCKGTGDGSRIAPLTGKKIGTGHEHDFKIPFLKGTGQGPGVMKTRTFDQVLS